MSEKNETKEESDSGYAAVLKMRMAAFTLLVLASLVGFFVYSTHTNPESEWPFRLGLDLTGGSHLVYQADVSNIAPEEVEDSMNALRDVIERRVNLFGVAEPLVQIEKSSALVEGGVQERLIVELPGVTDVEEAIKLIGQTPLLEFKLVDPNSTSTPIYIETGITGRFVERAQLGFGSGNSGGLSNEPHIIVDFNSEGSDLFGEVTSNNVGEQLAIFLDGELLSDPVIQEAITGGAATISGSFTPESARDLAKNLNFGALPVPINLLSTQSIGASLGEETLQKGITAGIVGLSFVALFLMLWYRVPGVVAVVALAIYVAVMLAIFKVIPITLTAAGLAGFILSIGMAVDANILIFERVKEELLLGKKLEQAIRDGFARAWLPIRDGNLSSILTAIILFWFGTSIVEGFALTFGIGIIISMITAITVTRTLLLAVAFFEDPKTIKTLFGNGLR